MKIVKKNSGNVRIIFGSLKPRFLLCIFNCVFVSITLLPSVASAHDEVVNGSPYRIQVRDLSLKEPGFLRSINDFVVFRTVSSYQRPSNFTLEDAGDGFVHILIGSRRDKKYLVLERLRGKYRTRSLTDPDQGTLESAINLKWRLISTKNGFNNTFRIRSALNGVYLTLEEVGGNIGSRLAFTDEESSARKWTLGKASTPIAFTKNHANLAIGELCPTTLTRGDREFNGNGPKVSGSAELVISGGRRAPTRILALIEFKAEETQDNWSSVENDFIVTLLENPYAWRAKRITSPYYNVSTFEKVFGQYKRSLLNTTADSTGDRAISRSGPLRDIVIRGDTGGNDISDNSECSDDTKVERMAFNTLQVEYEYRPR